MSVGEGVLEQWKAFRRLTVEAAVMVLKLDSDEQTIVLDNEGIEEISPEVRVLSLPTIGFKP